MPTKLELLQEAEKRGLLPPEKSAALNEVMKRESAEPGLFEKAVGVAETAGTMLSAIPAEVVAGVAGAGSALINGADEGAETVKSVREAMTYQPRGQEGKENLQAIGEAIQPAADAIGSALVKVEDTTGIPREASSAALQAIPELIGFGLSIKGAKAASRASKTIAGRVNKGVTNKVKVFDDAGQFTDDAIRVIQEKIDNGALSADDMVKDLSKSGVLTPEQIKRYNLFKRRGVEPTRANLTQKTDHFRAQGDLAKGSNPLSELVARQDSQLSSVVSDAIERIGPAAQDLPGTNASVFRVVDDVVTDLDDKVSQAYRAASEAAKGQPRVTVDNLSRLVSSSRGNEKISGGVISAIRQELKNKGLLKKGKNLDVNKRGARLSGEDVKKITVAEAEEIRKSLNNLWDSATPQGRRLIRQFKDAIDKDVEKAVGSDIFKDARAAKVEMQRRIERASRNKFDKTRGSFLEDVIDNKIPEEKITARLLAGRDDDMLKMKEFLMDSGEAGQQAWKDIKANVLRDALEKATSTMGKGEGGQAVFNSRLFEQSLGNLRKSKKFNILFDADEASMIDDVIEIGRLRNPQRNVALGSGPSGSAIKQGIGLLLDSNKTTRAIKNTAPIFQDARTIKDLVNPTRQTEKLFR